MPKKLPPKATIALIIGGDLLLLVVGWFLLIGPQRATAASIKLATASAQAQIAQAKIPVPVYKAPPALKQPEIQTADLYSLAKAMPSTVDQPNLLLELDQIARSAGVDVSTISFSAPTAGLTDPFSTVPIALAFSGDFYSVTDMLYRLRTLVSVRNGALQTSGRLFSVGSVGLTPAAAASGSTGKLTAAVALNAYVYGNVTANAAAATAPAPVAPPASTDTTQTATTAAPSSDVAPAP